MAKRKLTIWVEDGTAQKIEQLARLERLSVSQFGAQMLERAVTEYADNLGWDMVGARIEEAVRREVGRMSDRLGKLMVRAALEAGASRGMIYNLVTAQQGEESAKRINSTAWNYSLTRLKSPINDISEILKINDGQKMN